MADNFIETEMSLTNSAVRVFLQVRTTRDASSTLRAAPVCGYPFAALCHVLHLTVTACKRPGQAVCTEAEANMKNPSKAVLLQCERRLLLLVSYAAKLLSPPCVRQSCQGSLEESLQPEREERGWTVNTHC